MPRSIAMSTIVQRAQRRCDRESDSSIVTAEWKALASEVYGELCQEINDTGCRYFETTSSITATGAASYNEPSDVLHFIGIDFVVDSAGSRRRLAPLPIEERTALLGQTGEARYYQVVDDQIVLYPKPSSGSYTVLYIPQPTDLSSSADADLIDLVCPAGERFQIWGMASLAQHKLETNQQRAVAEWERARQDLRYWAANRNLINPPNRRFVDRSDPDDGDPDAWSDPPP